MISDLNGVRVFIGAKRIAAFGERSCSRVTAEGCYVESHKRSVSTLVGHDLIF